MRAEPAVDARRVSAEVPLPSDGQAASSRRRRVGVLCVLGSAVAFAVAPIFGKVAYAHGVDSFALLALRFGSATFVVWALVLALGLGRGVELPGRGTVLRVLALGAVVLPAREDATLADGTVRVAAGHASPVALGAMFGPITVEKA